MPNRRTILAGVGALAAAGTGAVATGAFSAATAERDVNVEFDDDVDAILGFESTSEYTQTIDEDGVESLGIDFDNLNVNTDFTFQDVFVIRNNGTQSVRFDRVQSADGDANWNYELRDEEEESSPARVLVADGTNAWQGDEPDEDFLEDGFTLDDNYGGADSNVGRTEAADALDGSDGPILEPGDWIAVGFGFWGVDGVGSWGLEDVPAELQLNFQADDLDG